MKVEAAVLEEVGAPIRVQSLDLQEPQEGEVLVRMLAVGVCHSDWHVATGDTSHPLPAVLGHEGAGVVESLGAGVQGLGVGDLVALNWAPSCGECFYCGVGRPALCQTYVGPVWAGTMLDGTTRFSRNGSPVYHYSALACFAERVVVPSVCCVQMPAGTSAESAALIGCAVTTGVGSAVNTAKVEPGSAVCVIGAGGVGLSTVMGAACAGAAQTVVFDPMPSRQEKAIEIARGCGIAQVSAFPEIDPARVQGLTDGRGADYVFECVGSPALLQPAVDCARPGGTIVVSGLAPMASASTVSGAKLVREEKAVLGSYYGTSCAPKDFPKYAQWCLDGKLPLERLVTHRYGLSDINRAYKEMLDGTSARGLIVF